MSLQEIKPISYTPIRVKEEEVLKFFQDLKARKLVRGENLSTYKITDKPLASTKVIQKHSGFDLKIERSKHKSSSKKSATSTSEQGSSKKRKVSLEKRVAHATL